MSVWRPPSVVRLIAIGIVRRGDELLLMAVRSDDGAIKGYRPLGGSIEFGERAAEALKREFVEELGLAITEPVLLTVIEISTRITARPGTKSSSCLRRRWRTKAPIAAKVPRMRTAASALMSRRSRWRGSGQGRPSSSRPGCCGTCRTAENRGSPRRHYARKSASIVRSIFDQPISTFST